MSKIAIVSYWHDTLDLETKLVDYDAVFATDRASVQLLEAGIEIEAAIADFDSVDKKTEMIKRLELHTEVVVLDENKDMSDTEAALVFAANRYPKAEIDVYNMLSGRVDHTLALLSLFNLAEQKVTIISPSSSISLLEPGSYDILPLVDYQYVSFHALETVRNIELTNLKYPVKLDILPLFSSHLISNEFLGEAVPATITFDFGKILCIHSKDE